MAREANEQMSIEEFAGGASAANRRRAKSAQAAGKQFEKLLASQHDLYRATGRLWLIPHALPTMPAGSDKKAVEGGGKPGGSPLRRVTGPAPYDFEGRCGKATAWPGRSVVVEAKSNSAPKKSLSVGANANKRGGLDLRQWATLSAMANQWGAIATVVWRNGNEVGVLMPGHLMSEQVPDSLPTTLFRWLAPGSVDWWTPLEQALAGKP